jgi:2-polyprenyl-3-methyl-5-hydroxy-6-metoxy-1,4-benzoquinol methylase
MKQKITFSFGKNWNNYVETVVNDKVLAETKNSMLKYLPIEEYKGKNFIDVGCGSGLFSLSSVLLGCKKTISIDVDDYSIKSTLLTKNKFSSLLQDNIEWEISKGDILDNATIESIINQSDGGGDIVYSWGVLHHTGNMWEAIRNCAKLVKPGGYFIIAIYNHAPSSKFWQNVKIFYNKYERMQPIMNLLYGSYVSIGYMIHKKTFKLYRDRGMHVFYDAIDWLGGYPYEYACFDEIKSFVENLNFELFKQPTKLACGKNEKINFFSKMRSKDTGCNEFVFLRLRDTI